MFQRFVLFRIIAKMCVTLYINTDVFEYKKYIIIRVHYYYYYYYYFDNDTKTL